MGREFELKFRATEAQQAAILEKYEGFRKIAMETTYYDTADRALSARRITLRQRKENGAPFFLSMVYIAGVCPPPEEAE